MANALEIIVISELYNTSCTCSIWDPHSFVNIMNYKGGGFAENHTLGFIGKDYLAAVEKSKPVLHIWPLNSQRTVDGIRFILPGKATALAFSPDGNYFVAGIEEKIYLWQTTSGNLLTIINRHYQKVNLLKFTADGRFFISAAEDGIVMVWSLATVSTSPLIALLVQSTAGQHDPVYIFSDHSLPVTDMYVSKNGIHGRLYTVSSDRSCKIYDLTCGEMLLNLVFDEPLSAVTLDVLELNVFVGTAEGKIFGYSITNPPRRRDVLLSISESDNKFVSHTKAVTCLSVSFTGEKLLSGSNDENIILWEISSKQPIKMVKLKGPVSNAFFSINYRAIYNQYFTPSIILQPIQKTVETKRDYLCEIEVLVKEKNNFWPKYAENRLDDNDDYFSKEIELESKQNETKLTNELEKLKKINSNLYALSVGNALKFKPSKVISADAHTVQNHPSKKKKKSNKRSN